VLAARPAFDVEALPLGPGRITAALRYAVAVLDLPLDHRIAFYQVFDRLAMNGAGALYVAANAYLAEQRILKHLQLQSINKPRQAPPPPAPEARTRENYTPPRPRGSGPTESDVAGFGLAVFEVASSRVPAPSAPVREARETRDPRPQRVVYDSREAEQFA